MLIQCLKTMYLISKANATPLSDELDIYNELFALLVQPNAHLLSLLQNYKSASEEIRIAISTPSDQNEKNALEAVSPTIDMLRQFYEYSSDLEKGIPRLLDALFKNGSAKDLNQHPGLTKLYANILDFVFEFDCLKFNGIVLKSGENHILVNKRTLMIGPVIDDRIINSTLL
ncbi:DUF1394-domain-containing protein [Backusella circina FSU 941]|nr:DUF1394-domain-containing protein [Backusella circina FSU 941]